MISLTNIIFFILGTFIGLVISYIFFSKKREETGISNKVNDIEILVRELVNNDAENINTINKLSRALTGSTKRQGKVGEIILSNILENTGFREGSDFETQKHLEGDFEGEFRKKYPDVVFHLPGGRDLIIDSKLSFDAWTEYCESTDTNVKADAMKRHITSVRNHIKNLGNSNYQRMYGIKSLDSVIMFMPYEGAFDSLQEKLEDIIYEANDHRVVLTNPSTLIAILKIIETMWSVEKRNENADKIIKIASEIHDEALKSYESFAEAEKSLLKSVTNMEKARSRLKDGKGSLLSRVKKMMGLGGLKSSKKFDNDDDDDEENDN